MKKKTRQTKHTTIGHAVALHTALLRTPVSRTCPPRTPGDGIMQRARDPGRKITRRALASTMSLVLILNLPLTAACTRTDVHHARARAPGTRTTMNDDMQDQQEDQESYGNILSQAMRRPMPDEVNERGRR